MVIPVDEERRLPTQTVTARRGSGNSANIGSIISIVKSGAISDLASVQLQSDAYTLAVACNRNPGGFVCRELACEINPSSNECELRLNKIIVTVERPKSTPVPEFFTVSVEFSFNWFTDLFKQPKSESDNQRRKELEKQCQNTYKGIFTDLAEFNFGYTFDSAVGGSKEPLDGRAANDFARRKLLKKLVKLTKPIMTSGVNGMRPVMYLKGQEAVNGLYLGVNDNNFTRGTHVSMEDKYDGTGTREFHKDEQYKYTKGGGAGTVSQRLVVDFHTHPFSFATSNNIPFYAWPSAQDIFSHVNQRISQSIDRYAILAIGFMVEENYYMQIIETHNDISTHTLLQYVFEPERFGKYIQLLINSNTKIAIIGENGRSINYMDFFKNNKTQTLVQGIQITPSSCDKL